MSTEAHKFGPEALSTWSTILCDHRQTREEQVIDLFNRGLELLEIDETRFPSLDEINEKLVSLTGWRGVFVNGLEGPENFYAMLARREFPVGQFIRDKQDITYTPEPDIVHDLYGHLPFFTDARYAKFCEEFAKATCEFKDKPGLMRQFERFFWFTIEFGLIQTNAGRKVFGAGIASSTGECAYSLSGEPEVLPFDIDVIRHQEFRIDEMQKRLFLIENVEQLYSSLPELKKRVSADLGGSND